MKTTLKITGIIIAVLIVIVVAIPFFISVNSFRPEIESRLGSALGRSVKVGNLSLQILSGSVGADQLAIADDPKFSSAPCITAKSLKVGVELMPLVFRKQLNITEIVIDQPDITLLRNQAGVWNFSSLGTQAAAQNQAKPAAAKTPSKPVSKESKAPENNAGTPENLTVAKFDVKNGRVSVGEIPAKRKAVVYDKVDISMRNFSFTNSFPVTLSANLPGGGNLKLDGTAGPINSTDTALTPLDAKLKVTKLDLSQSGMVAPSAGISGMADFDGTIKSDGHVANTSGTLKANGLKVVAKGSPSGRPIDVKYSLEHDLQKRSGRILQGDVSLGKALAKLTGTYQMQGDTTTIHAKLSGQNMPVDDLQAVLPAVGVVLPSGSQLKGGTLSMDLDLNGPLDKLVTTGPLKLNNTQLAGFNLGSKLSAISALSGKQTGNDTSIQNLSTTARVAPDGTQLNNINLIIPAIGTLAGGGTISPSNAIDFKMVANLSGGAVTGLTQMAGLGGKGSGNIPFMIQGTTSDPKFMPDVKGIVNSQLKGLLQQQMQGNQQNPQNPQNPLNNLMGLFGKKKQPPPK
jgi:AsmA protein